MTNPASNTNLKNRKVLILHTGGTLGMDLQGTPDDVGTFRQSLEKYAPRIFEVAEISIQILFNKDSSNMRPIDWIALATRIYQEISKFDGIVVVHGTDTMAFSASALSFMLQNLPKPVIFTGSQRPLMDLRSDAPRNLIHAVELAAGQAPNEISIFFDSLLIRGNRAKKISIPSFGAFDSPNMPPLAKVGVEIEHSQAGLKANGPFTLDPRIETRIASVSLFPGIDAEMFLSLIQYGIKGLILKAFGPGDIPLGEASLVHMIRKLTASGIPTIICSQAIYGRVDLTLYETGRAALRAGAIPAVDMTWEAALTKMMVLLGRGYSMQTFAHQFTLNLAGELTEEATAGT